MVINVCVCVCVCMVFFFFPPQCQPNCTIMRFGVLCKVDRWHCVWSIFDSCTTWADHIMCGSSISIVYWRKLRLGWLCGSVCVVQLCYWVWDDDERKGEGENLVPTYSLLFLKSTKGPPGLTSLSDIAINSTICLLNIYYCGGPTMNNLAIRKFTSPPFLVPKLKFSNENLWPRRGSNPGPAEQEADILPSEPGWQVAVNMEI